MADKTETDKIFQFFFRSEPELQLVETRFTHPLLEEGERQAVRGRKTGCFEWTRGVKALCVFFLKWAAWSYKDTAEQQSEIPRFEGNRPSLAATLNDSLTKQNNWLIHILGSDEDGQSLLLQFVTWRNRDFKTVPGEPVSIVLDCEQLPPGCIKIYVDEGLVDVSDLLDSLADEIVASCPMPSQPDTAEVPARGFARTDQRDCPAVLGVSLLPQRPRSFIGRGTALEELKVRLRVGADVNASGASERLVVVRGWPGVGKSTLAAVFAYEEDVHRSYPDGVLWASLGPDALLISELAAWGRCLGDHTILKVKDVREATTRLRSLLHDRQMLLIVDDAWETEHATAFLAAGPKCATIVTTRLPIVADALAARPGAVYVLPSLDEHSALELLGALAPEVVRDKPAESRKLAVQLEGLPLALQVAGRLLHAEIGLGWGIDDLLMELQQESKILEMQAPADCADLVSQTTPTVAALLRRSTDKLSPEMRECFAMLGPFAPKPATFDAEAMAAVWERADPKPVIREMVNRGLLEPAADSRFQMHGILVVLAKSLLDGRG